ncbi:MAG: non-homologous end joining protein Ku, partial [Pirellulaceae bacterium]
RAYSVCEPASQRISFHQLHSECHSRIRYQKVCPLHGEVPNDEIVKGYEYSKNQYVVFEPEELERLRAPRERSLNIRTFVHPEKLDPIYFSGKSYYLTPDGAMGQKPYALLHEAIAKEGLYAVAQAVLSGTEELTVLRPVGPLLAVSSVDYESEIRDPQEFVKELVESDFSSKELELTKSLIEATTEEDFDLSQFQDVHATRLRELVEGKVQGKEIVAAPSEELPPVINLMDALRESIAQAKGGRASPGKKRAATARQRKPARRKKTG